MPFALAQKYSRGAVTRAYDFSSARRGLGSSRLGAVPCDLRIVRAKAYPCGLHWRGRRYFATDGLEELPLGTPHISRRITRALCEETIVIASYNVVLPTMATPVAGQAT